MVYIKRKKSRESEQQRSLFKFINELFPLTANAKIFYDFSVVCDIFLFSSDCYL